ncbi:MAG: 8-oxo-dGTP pyrophosphatase MutT (NUDIX family) [Cyclobacteriaceae bacterium]|jgi:8-oxo-dGTP pyrophosphatase MutT (NUDIX family)
MANDFISMLENRLKKPLPGAGAHMKMKPILPSGINFRSTDSTNARKGGVLILFYQKDNQWYFPLIQRPMYDGIHSGQVAFPGGGMEESDSDQYETALRESFEEIGIEQHKVQIVGALSEFFVAVSNYMVLPVIGVYPEIPHFIPDPREVDEVIEVPLNQLLDRGLLKEKEITAASGYRLWSPYFELENRVVWGATAMMLSELVDIINELNNG